MRRTPTPRPKPRRGGFTLIELLVAAALSLVVMTVLSLAFQTGMQTLSQLKSVVGMSEQLRAAEGVLRRDLVADHLAESADGDAVLLSGMADFLKVKNPFADLPPVDPNYRPQTVFPTGYVRINQGDPLSAGEGPAPFPEVASPSIPENNLNSFRTPTADKQVLKGRAWGDYLAFTIRLKGTNSQEVFSTPVGASNLISLTTAGASRTDLKSADPTNTQLVSRWAEVAYFLVPSGSLLQAPSTTAPPPRVFSSTEGMTSPAVEFPLYTLYRRQRVLVPQTITPLPVGLPALDSLPGLAAAATGLIGVNDIATAANRLGASTDRIALDVNAATATLPGGAAGPLQMDQKARPYPIPAINPVTTSAEPTFGSDVLLTNVVSMTVRPVYGYGIPKSVQDTADAQSPTAPGLKVFPVPAAIPATDLSPRDVLPSVNAANTGPLNPATGVTTGDQISRLNYPRFFDTGTPGNGIPMGFNLVNSAGVTFTVGLVTGRELQIKAIEIKLRVYDAKNKTSRQMTVLQDL